MIVATILLIFMLLVFLPIRVRIDAKLFLPEFTAHVNAKLFFISAFDETFSLSGRYLQCEGTVDTDIDVSTVDKNGIDIFKCVTVDKVCVSFCNNITSTSIYSLAFQNILVGALTEILCGIYQGKIYSSVLSVFDKSNIRAQIIVSFNLFELILSLIKQGVKLWTRKSVKS